MIDFAENRFFYRSFFEGGEKKIVEKRAYCSFLEMEMIETKFTLQYKFLITSFTSPYAYSLIYNSCSSD